LLEFILSNFTQIQNNIKPISHNFKMDNQQLCILNYYNEYDNSDKTFLYNSKLRFLGIEYVKENPLRRFEMQNGLHIRRQLSDKFYYEHVPTENDIYTEEDIKKIKFKEIKYTGTNMF
jgi:hypothetical protein